MQKRASNRKALPARAGTGGIRVVELESFAIQAVGEIQFSSHKVEQAFGININIHAIVLKQVVAGLLFVVEPEVVGKARTSAALD